MSRYWAGTGCSVTEAQARGPWWVLLFVWGVWGGMSLAATAFVLRYGSTVPTWDYWELVPVLTGHRTDVLPWLWEQHNEHRIPLPKLIHLAIARLTGDFRAVLFVGVSCLIGVSALVLVGLRQLRGRQSYTDVFVPLALLHVGQYDNLLGNFQIAFVLSAALSHLVLVVMAVRVERFNQACTAAICVLMLVTTGANGLIQALPLAVWIGVAALAGNARHKGQAGWIVSITSLAAILFVSAIYFVGYQPVARHGASPGLWATTRGALQFLATGIGPAGGARMLRIRDWPLIGFPVAGAGLATLVWLGLVWKRRRADRLCIVGMLLFGCAQFLLAAAVGWGRAGLASDAALVNRYGTLAVALLTWIYLAWSLWGDARTQQFVRVALTCALCSQTAFNVQQGCAAGRTMRTSLDAAERDMRQGLPSYEIAVRHHSTLYPAITTTELARRIDMLRSAGMGPYRSASVQRVGRP